MKKVYIVGLRGNMGQRYKAILEHLGVDVYGHDVEFSLKEQIDHVDGFIVASPTHTHIQEIRNLYQYEKPILSEKPITKKPEELSYLAPKTHLLTLVNQYKYLTSPSDEGDTYYDYFKTGSDGLYWDCINVIGLSKRVPAFIKNRSPFWLCSINGRRLNLSDMDAAYVNMMKDWLSGAPSNFQYALEAHRKVLEWFPS